MQSKQQFFVRCRKIVKELVEESFSELKDKRIVCFYFPKYFGAVAFSFNISSYVFIGFTKRALLSNFSSKSLIGLLAHELSHMNRFSKMSFIGKCKLIFGYYFSNKISSNEEAETDRYIIKLGYASKRYALARHSEKGKSKEVLAKSQERGYMSSEEIKNYAKSINKW